MPRGGPRPNSGRKKGSRNKRSIGIAERMVEAGGASTGSAATQPPAKKLARDVLEDFMLRFTSMAERETDPIKFERYARFAVYCAKVSHHTSRPLCGPSWLLRSPRRMTPLPPPSGSRFSTMTATN